MSQLRSKVTHILQFLRQMFNVSTCCWTTFKLATPLTNGVINETLRQFVPLSDMRCDGIFSDDIIANFLLILTVKRIPKSVNI